MKTTDSLKAMPLVDLARAFEILSSPVCQCGRTKEIRYSALCHRCLGLLPADARNALYRRVGEGFAEAYERACELLRQAEACPTQLELGS